MSVRRYVLVPFDQKDEAKQAKAKWDVQKKLWFFLKIQYPKSLPSTS